VAGAIQLTVTCPSPAEATTPVGAPGTVASGITHADAVDAGPVPTPFWALTVKLYGVPFLSPDTVQTNGPEVHVHVFAVGELVTVYLVIGLPPEFIGADQKTMTRPLPGLAVGVPGLVGVVAGTRCTEADGAPVPSALRAFTVKAYVVPLRSPLTVVVNPVVVMPAHAGQGGVVTTL